MSDDLSAGRHNWKSVDYWEKPIHPMRSTVGKMPWHTDDKPFGVTQEEWDEMQKPLPFDGSPDPKDLQYCHCGRRGTFFLTRWYCQECWDAADDE